MSSSILTEPRERALGRRLRYLRDWELANVLVVPGMLSQVAAPPSIRTHLTAPP